jgi:hypothetical protein
MLHERYKKDLEDISLKRRLLQLEKFKIFGKESTKKSNK